MEILTHKHKLNIKFKAVNVCDVRIIDNTVLISVNIDNLSTTDKFKIYNYLKDCRFNSIKYITLLVGINEVGAIDINKCRVVWEECLLREEIPFNKSVKCNLNALEKCSIVSMFMPSYR